MNNNDTRARQNRRAVPLALGLLLFAVAGVALAYPVPQFQAGEAGLAITWQPNPPNEPSPTPFNLEGFSVVMTTRSPLGVLATMPSVVASGGATASYLTQATDFATPGTYRVQFIATEGAHVLKSPVEQILVKGNLP